MATSPIDLSAGLVPAQQQGGIDLSAGLVPAGPTVAPNGNSFSGDTSGFKPADTGGGFLSHLWNNINPANMVSGIGQMLQRPVQTYLNDEQQRAADLKSAGSRASKIVHSDAGLGDKALGLLDTGVQAAGDFVPFVGTAANHAADELGQGKIGAGLGDAAGLGLTLAAPSIIKAAPEFAAAAQEVPGAVGAGASKVANVARTVKNAVTVSPELKTAAAAVPADADVALASRKLPEIQAGAKSSLQSEVGQHFDALAAQAPDTPVDTSSITGLGNKANAAADAWKNSGQSIYKKLDEAAKQATGSDAGFQRVGENIDALKDEIADPKTSDIRKAEAAKSLLDAQAQQEEFIRLAEQQGIPNVRAAIGEANKRYSTGLSLREVGRRFGLQETQVPGDSGPVSSLTGGGNQPLQAPLRSVADPVQPRGHVLKQALGEDRAAQIQQSVANATQRIADEKAATSAAKERVQAVKQSAADAQTRVKAIRGRQGKIAAGAAALVGGKVLYGKSRDAYSALKEGR